MRYPLRFEYDADMSGDPPAFHTCQAAIYDADGACIVEEPGPDATWRDLEELVRLANLGQVMEAGVRMSERDGGPAFPSPMGGQRGRKDETL